MTSQCKLILNYLKENGTITQREAIDLFGCYRLSARIYNLRALGYAIVTNVRESINRWGKVSRFAEYKLIEQ